MFFSSIFLTLFLSIVVGSFVIATVAKNGILNWGLLVGAGVSLFLLLFFGRLLFYAWYFSAYIKRYYYDCNDRFVIIQKGVFSPTEIHVQYEKIQDVYVDQDVFDRLLGLYDVHIANATVTSGIEAHIDGVDQPTAEALKNLLLAKIAARTQLPASPPAAQMTSPVAVQVNQPVPPADVSIKTFPLEPKWVAYSIVSSVFSSFFVSIFLYIFFVQAIVLAMVAKGVSSTIEYVVLGFVIVYLIVFTFAVVSTFVWRGNFWWEFAPEFITRRQGFINR